MNGRGKNKGKYHRRTTRTSKGLRRSSRPIPQTRIQLALMGKGPQPEPWGDPILTKGTFRGWYEDLQRRIEKAWEAQNQKGNAA